VLAANRTAPPAIVKPPETIPRTEPAPGEVRGPELEPAITSSPASSTTPSPPLGIGLQVGGGVDGFSSSVMPGLVRNGGYWDGRLIIGLRKLFSFELAYLGSAHPLVAPGITGQANLVGHGAEGGLRINLPLVRDDAFFSPYGMVGLGWMHYHVSGGANDGTVLASNDSVETIPLGGGITIGHRHLYFDARVVYRLTSDEDLIRENPRSGQLRQWSFGGAFGYVF